MLVHLMPCPCSLKLHFFFRYEDHLDDMNYYELLRLAKTISFNPPTDTLLQPFLKKFVACFENKHLTEIVRTKELEQLAWFLFHVNYSEKGIFERIFCQIGKCNTSHPHSGRNLVYLTSILLKAGVLKVIQYKDTKIKEVAVIKWLAC